MEGSGAPGQRPRLLFVNWRDIRNPAAGGAELHLQEVARRLVRDGFACIQYAHAFPGCLPVEVVDGVEIHRMGGAFLFNYTAFLNLRRWIRLHRIDIVIDDSNKIPFLLPWVSPVPVVARFHHLFGAAIFRETNPLAALYVYLFESLIGPVYRGVPIITVSPSTRAELEAKGLAPISVALNGVDFEHYRVLPGVAKRPFLIAHVGRLMRYKNVDTLLRAFAIVLRAFPEARLVIGGDGNHRSVLEKLATDLGVSAAVDFRGYITGEEKIRLYNEAAVFVNPSLKEGWGLTSIEANACGTPVVAADSPGLRDSVRHGETGLRVGPFDAAAYAAAIASIFASAQTAARLRAGALEWAAAHDWDRTAGVTREVLMAVYTEAGGRP